MKRLEEHLQIALCSFNMYQKNSSVRRVKQLFEKKNLTQKPKIKLKIFHLCGGIGVQLLVQSTVKCDFKLAYINLLIGFYENGLEKPQSTTVYLM